MIFVLIEPPVLFESIIGSCKPYCISIFQQKFVKLILMKILEIAATRCHILKAKMHQIRLRLRLSPIPRWGSLQRSPDTLAKFKGPIYF